MIRVNELKRAKRPFGFRLMVLLALIVGMFTGPVAASDLIITGVIDGPLTGGTPKGVELYVANDIADLSNYGLGSANNGGGSDGEEFTFPAVAANAGVYIWVASEATQFQNWFGFAPDYTNGAMVINGDDAIELFEGGTVIDVFGDINVDGNGEAWEYTDGWAYRKDTATAPSTTFNVNDWDYSGPDALDGETTNAASTTPLPQSSYSGGGGGAGVTITESAGSTDVNEAGATTDTYDIALDTVPASAVTITVTVADGETQVSNDGTNFGATTTVTRSDTTPATITVKAVDDADNEGAHTGTVTHTVTTGDGGDYTGALAIADVTVNISDDDAPGPACDTTGPADTCIHEVQGNGAASPIDGSTVTLQGIVVGDFQDGAFGADGDLNGFFIQEEDAEVDADAMTSEGVFVYDGPSPAVNVAVGDKVTVNGEISEYNDLTEITASSVTIVSSGNPLPTAASANLPVASADSFERFEGMRVNFPQTLYVTEIYDLARYGEIVFSSGGRLNIPTNVTTPGAAATDLQEANDLNRILLDDGSTLQNPDPTPHGLSASNTIRGGYTVTGLSGVMTYSFDKYRIQPVDPVSFTASNPRPATPPNVGGTIKVASFNVLNYFTTLGAGTNCGPSGTLGCRGATNPSEFNRQRDKIISAIVTMNADIVGLMEMENTTATSGLQDLVDGLNDATSPGTYAYLDTGTIGDDAIRVALIYKPGSVSPVGSHAILDDTFDPDFTDDKNRPSLAQTFAQNSTGEKLTVVVNHLKSKGSGCGGGDDDSTIGGQGNCNGTRTKAAAVLKDWLLTDPTNSGDTDFLLIGDFNAYAKEDPITTLEAAGYVNEASGYSYGFQGQWGTLDHALTSGTLHNQVTGAAKWHINADEPRALDYNEENKSAGQISSLYNADPYRASDHDPIIIGINLGKSGAPTVISGPVRNGGTTTSTSPTFTVGGAGVTRYRYKLDDGEWSGIFPVSTPIQLNDLSLGTHVLSVVAEITGQWQSFDFPTIIQWTIVKPSPQVLTTMVSNITENSARSGGTVLYDDTEYTILKRGVTWATHPFPRVFNDFVTVDGKGSGEFMSMLTGLSQDTTYYYRAYVTYRKDGIEITDFGREYTFTTAAPTYAVTFTAGPNGTLSGELNQSVKVGNGTTAVEAVPNAGYTFTGWTGGYEGDENPLMIATVNAELVIVANFERIVHEVLFLNNGTGTLSGQTFQMVADGGDAITVVAEPADGYLFTGWTGDVESNEAALTLTNISKDMRVFANFQKIVEKGDANGDGATDLKDAVMILKLLGGISEQGRQVNMGADTNGDGVLGLADVLFIMRRVAEGEML